ncbi:MAG: IS3 family transposase [Planctomycetaceae bacterium]|nr:IS3 family transposase [Planctomycetaceae bacterium]
MSERRACEVADQPRSTQRYEPRPASDEAAVVTRMHELVRGQPRFGYRRIAVLLQREGFHANFQRVYRLWRRDGLKVPQKPRKKRRLGTIANSCVRRRAEHRNHVWCWDFMFERTTQGSSLKWLSVVDEYTRECLVLKVSRSITSADVIDFFQGLFVAHGVPVHIRSDHGREFLAAGLRDWLAASTVGPLYVAPASPWENGYAESFHSEVRDEFLACEVFETVKDAQALGTAWRRSDNEVRPPLSLGSRTPAEFALACAASVRPTASLQQHTLNTPALS